MHSSNFKETVKIGKTTAVSAILTVAFGLMAVLYSDIALPIAAAAFASLLTVDRSKKKAVSLLTALLILGASAVFAALVFHSATVVVAACALFAVGTVIFLCYHVNFFTKFDAAVYSTLIFTTYLFAMLYFASEAESVGACLTYYNEEIAALREKFVSAVSEFTVGQQASGVAQLVTPEAAGSFFDNVASYFFGFVAVTAFAASGIALKLYTSFLKRTVSDTERVASWLFLPAPIYAYCYPVLFFLSLFLGSSNGAFAVCVRNLELLFLAALSYVGLRFVFLLLGRARSRVLATVILIVFTVAFSSVALRILAMLGVTFVLTVNRFGKMPPMNPNDSDGR